MTEPITTFQYSPIVRRICTAVWSAVLLFNLTEYVLAWVRVGYGWLLPLVDSLPPQAPFALFEPVRDAQVLPTLITAHLGLFIALLSVRTLAYLTPRITLLPDGLQFQTPLGRRIIHHNTLRAIRSIELPGGRFIVWVSATSALPLQNIIATWLFGRWFWRGFILTSDLNGFDTVIATVIAQLKQQYTEPQFAAHFTEQPPTALLAMLSVPLVTIKELIALEPVAISLRTATQQMLSVASCLLLPLLVSAFIHLRFSWAIILAPLLVLVEWPLVALYLFAISEQYVHRLTFDEALRLYPLTQLPRWLVAIGLTLLIAAGIPLQNAGWLSLILWFIVILMAIGLGVGFLLRWCEAWFSIESRDKWLSVVATIIIQTITYILLLVLLPS